MKTQVKLNQILVKVKEKRQQVLFIGFLGHEPA